ncbi:glycosyltransferase [Candidatus Planktophila lacus]|uniref:glycosyltransferase family 4 protein n=1 Tax=Candidatus Planktophila lacus TaxID=1884913 RepID=UPI000BACEB95|nr:glycosyltransferase family 1 protein [Candidatus Planktophila lacus]ASY24524.1 glycosyltransferase [Candidatus Planktophila lacus]
MNRINVTYDREIFLIQKYGGVSKYFSNLISKFSNDSSFGIKPHMTFDRTDNYHLKKTFSVFKPQRKFLQANTGWSTLSTLGPVREYSSHWAGGKCKREPSEIFHATYYRPTNTEMKYGKRLVVSVHDFIPEKLGWNGVRNPHIGKEKLVRKSDLVICVSNATASDLMKFYGISNSKIRVIHHGVDLVETAAVKSVPSRPSILYVGNRGGYKNFEVLVEAMKRAKELNIDLQLITAGSPLSKLEVLGNRELIEGNHWIHSDYPSESELGMLYSNSTLHCVTSKMEGFGMTILESMAHATPVVVSDIDVFREVGGEAACYFDPNSSENLLEKILWALGDNTYKSLSNRVLKYAELNTWDKAAQLHAAAYKSIV